MLPGATLDPRWVTKRETHSEPLTNYRHSRLLIMTATALRCRCQPPTSTFECTMLEICHYGVYCKRRCSHYR